MKSDKKFVYQFGEGNAEGDRTMKQLLGGKGANLAEMSAIGLPVPPGFTISAEACKIYSDTGEWPNTLEEQVEQGLKTLERQMGAKLGDPDNPLLLSGRSGAAKSMPGMMDSVLNMGLNDEVVEGLARKVNNKRFAYDSYRRFIDMFGEVVMGIDHDHFEKAISKLKDEKGAEVDTDLDTEALKELVNRYKAIYRRHTGYMFPQDPMEQLHFTITGVFDSWNNPRAVKYRRINKIRGLLGTAVNIQAMVFGNMGDKSATGVCFTRNPSNGERELYGEFLPNAQGEDVVAGIRTPQPIDKLKDFMPESYRQLDEATRKLEQHYQDMQDIEFTIQDGDLYLLQTRNGKRTGIAAVRIAVDMVEEELVDKEKAVKDLVEPGHVEQLLHPQLQDEEFDEEDWIGNGLPASPGAAVGKVVFDSDKAEEAHEKGEDVILVRVETSPEDVGGMSAAEGILTSRGGMTSHAAVVARGWGKPCVAGCDDIVVNYRDRSFTNGTITVKEGDWISIDGTEGKVIRGKKPLREPEFGENFHTLMKWVDEIRSLRVRTNADTPEDAGKAVEFGAEGIGLTRTEHMFFGDDRITAMRRMILSGNAEERKQHLTKLLPYQKEDFKGIFAEMEGRPVTIRLLDPPLHEFLPDREEELEEIADKLGITPAQLKKKVDLLEEFNPMMGHRGCRLGIIYPEITEMQTRAILEAAIELTEDGSEVIPEIMVPLVGSYNEFVNQKAVIRQTANELFEEKGQSVDYQVGTMIEVPRAAFVADQIAREADFFSFGTNDLTQLTFGFSRDDAGKFIPYYVQEKILPEDPFQSLDQEGVGALVKMAVEKGRSEEEDLKIGICGEHGGDPDSIEFCYHNGMNYVSCSPFRVPVARLAAAQSSLKEKADEQLKTERAR